MIIQGHIIEVMESLPPELIVESHGKRYFIAINPETRLIRQGRQVDYGDLKPSKKVLIKVRSSGTRGMISDLVHIMD